MNQIYVNIADENKDQIQNDNIQLEISESQDIRVIENTSEHQNIVQIASKTKFKIKQCDFCTHTGHLKKKQTIKQSYFLCPNCRQFIRTYPENLLHRNDSKLMKEIIIHVPQGLVPYDLQKGECRICHRQNQILYMFGKCCHYFCHPCLSLKICYNLRHRKYKIYCPVCDNLMDDYCQLYILYEILPIDHLIKPKMCCINKNCVLTILSEPYKEIMATSLIIKSVKAICHFCSKQFCALCWNSHKGACNYEKNFKDNLKKLGIVRCPRCNCPGQSELCIQLENQNQNWITIYLCQDQLCPLCGYRFCLDCLGPVQIYESINNISGYSCYKCKRKVSNWINLILMFIQGMKLGLNTVNWIQKIGLLILYLVSLAFLVLVFIMFLGKILIFVAYQHGSNGVKNVWQFHKRYYTKIPTRLQYIFLPVQLICLLVSFIIYYTITIVPAYIIHIKSNL